MYYDDCGYTITSTGWAVRQFLIEFPVKSLCRELAVWGRFCSTILRFQSEEIQTIQLNQSCA
jgi:hypothetical protein